MRPIDIVFLVVCLVGAAILLHQLVHLVVALVAKRRARRLRRLERQLHVGWNAILADREMPADLKSWVMEQKDLSEGRTPPETPWVTVNDVRSGRFPELTEAVDRLIPLALKQAAPTASLTDMARLTTGGNHRKADLDKAYRKRRLDNELEGPPCNCGRKAVLVSQATGKPGRPGHEVCTVNWEHWPHCSSLRPGGIGGR